MIRCGICAMWMTRDGSRSGRRRGSGCCASTRPNGAPSSSRATGKKLMTTFLLLRHGETDAVGKSIMGWRPGWHLNANGRKQVERLAARLAPLPIRAIYTSPLERAVETAEAVAKPHGIEPRPDPDLGEFHAGEWEGLAIDDLDRQEEWRRFNHFRGGTRAPGGELIIETQARMIRRIQALK